MTVATSVRRKRRGAVARYLKIGDVRPRPVAEPRVTESSVVPARGGIAGYLKIGNGQPRPAAEHRVTERTVRPSEKSVRPTEQTVRPPKAPAPEHKAPAPERKAPVKASSKAKMLKCYDCEGEIEAGADQCPHCALFLDPVRLARAA